METITNAILALSGLTLALAVLMGANRMLTRPGQRRRSVVVPLSVTVVAATVGAWTASTGVAAQGQGVALLALAASLGALGVAQVIALVARPGH